MSLKVLDPGLQLLLVGKPAFGLRNQGIPWGGPADWVSMAISNSLMGNPYHTPALEVCLAGPTLEASEDTALGIFGARFHMEVNRKPIRTSNLS
jgi:allophanate hydrolase subunit 2